MADVLVAGAGVVGAACALALARDGHAVTLIDRGEPGQGCSFGNAGVIAVNSVAPLASPALLPGLPRMLLDPEAPARIDPRSILALLPWCLRFARELSSRRAEHASRALAALTHDAMAAHRRLLAGTPAADLLQDGGWLVAYASQRAFRHDEAERQAQRTAGAEIEEWGPRELASRVPALGAGVARAAFYPQTGFVRDPLGVVQGMVRAFVEAGGIVHHAEIADVEVSAPGVALITAEQTLRAQHLVIALGVDSAALAARLGERVPLAAERGYHAMLPHAGIALPMPVLFHEWRTVATPMTAGLRLAGTSELMRPGRGPHLRRARMLPVRLRALLPGLDAREASYWSGARSTLPDSLPVLGPSARHRGVWYAFGHQHLGLTLAAVTAQALAATIGRRPAGRDLSAYRIDRF